MTQQNTISGRESSFLKGKITLPLLKFTIPLALTLAVQALYGAVDMIIVGQLAESRDVSAVGTGSLIMQTVTAMIAGLTMGITVRLGHSIGAKDWQVASQTISGAIILFGIVALGLTTMMVPGAALLATLMRAPEAAFDKTVGYISICSFGIVFTVAYNVITGIFRAAGNSKAPFFFIFIACVCNILGDLFFVGILRAGAEGTAYATVIAQAIGVLVSLQFLRKAKLPIHDIRKNFLNSMTAMREILKVGIPIASQELLNYASFMILAAIINSMGLMASVAMGIEGKVFSFFILPPVAFMSALSAFVAQNIGAKQHARAVLALKRGIICAFSCGIISFLIAFFWGEAVAGIFDKNPIAVNATAGMLKGAAFEHLIYPFVFCFLGYFNGRAMTVFVMLQGVICAFVVRIPLAWLLQKTECHDLFMIGLTLSASAAVSLILCLGYYYHLFPDVGKFIFGERKCRRKIEAN